jgi:hypothetical protein
LSSSPCGAAAHSSLAEISSSNSLRFPPREVRSDPYFCAAKVLCARLFFDSVTREGRLIREDDMSHSRTSATPTHSETPAVTDEPAAVFLQPDLISDDEIDYEEIAASTQPDFEAGRFAFNSDDYASDEECDAALEALLLKLFLEGSDDEEG